MPRQIVMPRLSHSTAEATVVTWLKKEGDRIEVGEPLVVVEVDKTSQEVTSETSGVVAKLLAVEGAQVSAGEALAIVAPAEEEPDAPAAMAGITGAASETLVGPRTGPERERRPISPAARRLSRELGLDPTNISGTGPGGLVTEKDVQAAARQSQPSEPTVADSIPYTGIRRTTGERLALSRRTAVDVTTVAEVDMAAVVDLRKSLNISYTAFVAKATASALRGFPHLNSSLDGDRILLKREVNLGVAVSVNDTLVVPVIRNADRLTCEEISREIDRLALKARERGLSKEDLSGSTFTITNAGAMGALFSTPIINYPEAAILGMGKVLDSAVVRDGHIVVRPMMYLSLSYDHRIVDGGVAVPFLQQIKRSLEDARSLLA